MSFYQQTQPERLILLQATEEGSMFVWDDEAQKAFEALKESLTTPPIVNPLVWKETFHLYISATTNVVSTVLVAEREEEGQAYPVQ
jgi:hypothetical protein